VGCQVLGFKVSVNTLIPCMDKYVEGVDIAYIASAPPASACLAKTGMLNGKLLFLLYPENLGALNAKYKFGLSNCLLP